MSDRQTTPSAARVLKKAQRLSLAGSSRSSSISRLASGVDASKRRSTLLSTPASNKRLSVYGSSVAAASLGAPSNKHENDAQTPAPTPFLLQALASSNSQSGTATGPQRKIDPRPIRDKNYQALISKEIYDFCIGNRFEMEVDHHITLKTLRQPTQKDFIILFRFLYCKIDPNYKFTRSVESEVFILLKILGYPYLDAINRSSISAVGGQNWPVFLGMLYWLVNLNLILSNLNDEYLVSPEEPFEYIAIKYTSRCYAAFIEQTDDYSEFYDEMKQEYETAKLDLSAQKQEKLRLNRELNEKFQKINESYGEIEGAREKSKALENDLKQFSAYMLKVKERQAQWRDILDQVKNDTTEAESRLTRFESQRKTHEEAIKEKGFSISEIDLMNFKRDKISKSFDIISNKIEDLKESIAKKDSHVHQSIQSLKSFVDQYNSMAARVPWEENEDFELRINSSLEIHGPSFTEPDAVLDKVTRNEKQRLLEIKSKVKEELLRVQEDIIRGMDQIDHVQEKISEQQKEIDSWDIDLKKSKNTQDKIYETIVSEDAIRSTQREKLDRDLQAIQIQSNKGVIELETRNKDLKIRLSESRYNLEQQREQLHEQVFSFLQGVIAFKLNIQEELEDLETITSQELDAEKVRLSSDRETHP